MLIKIIDIDMNYSQGVALVQYLDCSTGVGSSANVAITNYVKTWFNGLFVSVKSIEKVYKDKGWYKKIEV